MPSHVFDGLSLVDSTGRLILATIALTLVLGIAVNLWVRRRYAQLEEDLRSATGTHFTHPLLVRVVSSSREAASRSREPNTQAIIESKFQSELRPLLLGERFVRAATGLVIILGLMGTFYGLTLSIGRLVQLVGGGDGGGVTDVTQAVTTGLTHALSGMAVAFSNSLLGVASAVVLTVFGVFSNLTDRRVALMLELETYVDRLLSDSGKPRGHARAPGADGLERTVAGFEASVERLETVVGRFETAMSTFATSTRDFTEFNAHLKDNVQRMSLSFGDLSDTFKTQVLALKRGNGG